MSSIKIFIVLVLMSLSLGVKADAEREAVEPVVIEVYRSPSCSCCGKWLEHLKANQFEVIDHKIDDVQVIKDKYGVPANMASCHTALVNGYVIEGHVPAADIRKLLKIKPAVVGISVPGMPVGTPGMEMGDKKDPYKVVSFDNEKKYKVFSSYEGK
ncbi:MAG: DUF411 domain-containing protein [Methylococcaceae bacterium]